MTATKGFIHAAATTALDTRKAESFQTVVSSAGAPRLGVLGGNPSIVTSDASTAPMRVAVAAAGFVTQRSAADGVAKWSNDGSIFVTITKPVSNSHYVTVYAKHNDAAAGDASNLPVIDVVTGTAAASPTEAALPAGALKLATILVPSTATSSQSAGVVITNVYPLTAEAGGIVALRSSTEQAAWTPNDGLAYRIDTADLLLRVAGAWVVVFDATTARVAVTMDSLWTAHIDRPMGVLLDGRTVHCDGQFSNTGAGTFGTGEAPVGTIPVGYRPDRIHLIAGGMQVSGGSWVSAVFVAYPTGELKVNPGSGGTVGVGGINMAFSGQWKAA